MTTGTPQACASMSGIRPQRSPLISSGMTGDLQRGLIVQVRVAATEPAHFERDDTPRMTTCAPTRCPAATEPAHFERDDGSQKTSRLTCGNASGRESCVSSGESLASDSGVKVRARSLTWARALPGVTVSTEALAFSDDDRTGCWQFLMVTEEE